MTSPQTTARPTRSAWLWLIVVALVHLAIAWPGAAIRGINSEEIEPYLRHYPKVVDVARGRLEYVAPNDDAALLRAVERNEPVSPRTVATTQWPEVAYHGRDRVYPLFVRGHQTALGTWWGIVLSPLLGHGVAAIRRSYVLLELLLLGAAWGFARRSGMTTKWAIVAALGCVLSPGLWWFCRTGYGFELASRVFMMLTLCVAAPRRKLGTERSIAIGILIGLAILSRATIAATLVPLVIAMLAHPLRWNGWRRAAGALAIGAALPLVLVGLAMWRIHFVEAPGEHLPLERLAERTLTVPAFASVQLAWVADARVLLNPLVLGATSFHVGWIRPFIGGLVGICAVARWWHARASEAERLFVTGIIANSLTGAWLYGNPMQFQLGMALEPLFAIAVAAQVADVTSRVRALGLTLAAVLLIARAGTTYSLFLDEGRTESSMFSYRAQQGVLAAIREHRIANDDLLTTTYEHVGVWESWSDEAIRPIHIWRLLKARDVPQDVLLANWQRALDRFPACHVLLTRSPNLFAGRFADNGRVLRAFDASLAARNVRVVDRQQFPGENGAVVFELVTLSPCAGHP